MYTAVKTGPVVGVVVSGLVIAVFGAAFVASSISSRLCWATVDTEGVIIHGWRGALVLPNSEIVQVERRYRTSTSGNGLVNLTPDKFRYRYYLHTRSHGRISLDVNYADFDAFYHDLRARSAVRFDDDEVARAGLALNVAPQSRAILVVLFVFVAVTTWALIAVLATHTR